MTESTGDCCSPLVGFACSSELFFLPVTPADVSGAGESLTIRASRWRPSDPKASVLLVQGRGGFLEKYLPVVARLLQQNLEVVSFDWRGQGGSSRIVADPQAGYIDSFDDYLDDLQSVLAADLFTTRRRFVLAHSMGGHLLLRWLAEWHPDGGEFSRVWLTATLADLRTHPYPRWFARLMGALACHCGFSERFVFGGGPWDSQTFRDDSLTELTSDSDEVNREIRCLRQRPELRLGSPTFAWLQAAFRSINLLRHRARLDQITVPVTQYVAGHDRVVSNEAIRQLNARLPNGRLVMIPGALHDLLLERSALNQPLWSDIWQQLDRPDDPAVIESKR